MVMWEALGVFVALIVVVSVVGGLWEAFSTPGSGSRVSRYGGRVFEIESDAEEEAPAA